MTIKPQKIYLLPLPLIIFFLILSITYPADAQLSITQELKTQENQENPPDIPVQKESPNHKLPQEKNIDTYIILKLSKRRVYLYQDGKIKDSYPVAVGKPKWETPKGEFQILDIQYNPSWINPFNGKLIPPGPTNPMGAVWISFWSDGTHQIGFHGTPQEHLISKAVSHGCVRMKNRDILKLSHHISLGMKVKVVP